MKGKKVLTGSNGLEENITLKIEPMNMSYQTEMADKHMIVHASATGFNFNVSYGKTL
jgi:hypothetical protein